MLYADAEKLIRASRLKRELQEVIAEPILYDNIEKAPTELNLSITSNDINIELIKEFLVELRKNIYHGMYNEDMVDHIAKWINEREGKITVWEELVEKNFCNFYPESYDGEEEMLDEGDNWEIDPLEFISRNKRRIDESILRSNNTTTDSFFKPYLITHGKSDTKKEDEQSQTKRKYSNTFNYIDEQPNKRRCKAEKFEAIQYSLGPNEEYITIRSYEYDIWERNKDNMSKIYQDIFQKKDEGWKVTRTK
ncbi:hypothetical protein Tco_1416694 [Tanacetum coccineum]